MFKYTGVSRSNTQLAPVRIQNEPKADLFQCICRDSNHPENASDSSTGWSGLTQHELLAR